MFNITVDYNTTIDDAVTGLVDIFPTCYDFAGGDHKKYKFDGTSLLCSSL